MVISTKVGYGVAMFEGSVRALVTLARIDRAFNSRGYGIAFSERDAEPQTREFTWPGIGTVKVTRVSVGHYDVTFVAGRFRSWLLYNLSRS